MRPTLGINDLRKIHIVRYATKLLLTTFSIQVMTAMNSALVLPQAVLGIAESFVLLSLKWPVKTNPLVAWSDSDFAFAGALLIDLSFQGKVDSDLDNLIILDRSSDPDRERPMALRLLSRFGDSMRLDVALNELVNRIGDLRSETFAALAEKNIRLTSSKKFSWNFNYASFDSLCVREADMLRAALIQLVESDELPDPEQASLISLLYACEIAGPVLGGPSSEKWLASNGVRLDSIRRMDLVGRAVADVVAAMRHRLRTYLLDAGGEQPTTAKQKNKKSPTAAPTSIYSRGKTTWEWRAFWPENEIIELPASWGNVGTNSDSVEEENEDNYLFVHGKKDNIKIRGKGLKIKPVIEAFDDFIAFAPSAKFDFPEKASVLSEFFPRLYEVRGKLRSTDEMLEVMSATGYQPSVLSVSKTRRGQCMIFGVQIEFARILVKDRVFHSISLESPYLTALRILARNIPVGTGLVAGYSDFLDHIVRQHSE